MNKTALIASAALAAAAYAAYYHTHVVIIQRRFPDLDRKIVAKAHRLMMKRALAGEYAHLDDADETMDALFLDIVREMAASK